jgi:hypothetical protein
MNRCARSTARPTESNDRNRPVMQLRHAIQQQRSRMALKSQAAQNHRRQIAAVDRQAGAFRQARPDSGAAAIALSSIRQTVAFVIYRFRSLLSWKTVTTYKTDKLLNISHWHDT